jgi:hypothetical protein
MALSSATFRSGILARIVAANSHIPVFTSEVPEDSTIVYTNGLFTPFVVLYFGGPIRAARDHSLVSTRNDMTIVYCTAEVYAPRADTAAVIKDSLIDLLTGYSPTDCGELTLEGGLAYSRASNTVRPTQYIESTAWSARSNLSYTN